LISKNVKYLFSISYNNNYYVILIVIYSLKYYNKVRQDSTKNLLCRLVVCELYRSLTCRHTSNFDTLSTRFEFSSCYYLLFTMYGTYFARRSTNVWYIEHRITLRRSDQKMPVLIFAKTVGTERDTRGTREETHDPLVKNSITAHSRLPLYIPPICL